MLSHSASSIFFFVGSNSLCLFAPFFVVYPEIVLQNAVSMAIVIKIRIAFVIKDGLVPPVTCRPVLRSAFTDTVTILLGCVSVTLEFMVRCCV